MLEPGRIKLRSNLRHIFGTVSFEREIIFIKSNCKMFFLVFSIGCSKVVTAPRLSGINLVGFSIDNLD